MRLKPMLVTASRIHSAKGGVRASHALEDISTGAHRRQDLNNVEEASRCGLKFLN